MTLPILHRAPQPDDLPLILSDWLRSYRGSPQARLVPSSVYFAKHKELIDRLLQRSRTVIICNPEDTTQVFGWMCFELPKDVLILHYLYIKESFRKMGLAKQLVEQYLPAPIDQTIIICSHTGRSFVPMQKKYPLIYNPYIA